MNCYVNQSIKNLKNNNCYIHQLIEERIFYTEPYRERVRVTMTLVILNEASANLSFNFNVEITLHSQWRVRVV